MSLTHGPSRPGPCGQFLWVTCEHNYLSSTYHAPLCHSAQCARAQTSYCHTCASAARPGCHNNTCGLMARNPITSLTAMGELAQDVLSIQSLKGSNPGPLVSVPQFLFACAPSKLPAEWFAEKCSRDSRTRPCVNLSTESTCLTLRRLTEIRLVSTF